MARGLSRLLSLVIVLTITTPLFAAADMTSRDVLVPMVGRTPGSFGSQWQTDLVITNLDVKTLTTPVTIQFVRGSDGSSSLALTLAPRESVVLRDVVKSRFGIDSGLGYVRVSSSSPDARLSARARIYNVGSASGEYGQAVPGIPTDALMKQHYIPGLSGVGGNRSNVGVTNPWSIDVGVTFELIEASGDSRGSFTTVVPASGIYWIGDVFYEFGVAPTEGAMVRVLANTPVYAYGSVVRNDTGDATFIQGTGIATGDERLVAPQCASPAPVNMAPPGAQSAGDWIVIYRSSSENDATTDTLAARYGFTVKGRYQDAMKGFLAALTPQQIASLRCEATVATINENIVIHP